MRDVVHGSTNQSVVIRIVDSTDGTPEQSVEHNTAGVSLWYRREGATITAITPAALASLDAAHSDGGIEHIDDGYYRLDVPDAAFASGADGVMIGGFFTDMVVIGCYVPLIPTRLTASAVVDEFETQSQADPTGFHVNVMEVLGETPTVIEEPIQADLQTIKEQSVTCGAGVTINPQVGQDYKIVVNADGDVQVGTVQDGAIGADAVADIFSTTAITESYAADGAAGTVAQILYLIQQSLHEFAISSTTRTVKKLDKSTTAATFTLDDADTPTSTTRAS